MSRYCLCLLCPHLPLRVSPSRSKWSSVFPPVLVAVFNEIQSLRLIDSLLRQREPPVLCYDQPKLLLLLLLLLLIQNRVALRSDLSHTSTTRFIRWLHRLKRRRRRRRRRRLGLPVHTLVRSRRRNQCHHSSYDLSEVGRKIVRCELARHFEPAVHILDIGSTKLNGEPSLAKLTLHVLLIVAKKDADLPSQCALTSTDIVRVNKRKKDKRISMYKTQHNEPENCPTQPSPPRSPALGSVPQGLPRQCLVRPTHSILWACIHRWRACAPVLGRAGNGTHHIHSFIHHKQKTLCACAVHLAATRCISRRDGEMPEAHLALREQGLRDAPAQPAYASVSRACFPWPASAPQGCCRDEIARKSGCTRAKRGPGARLAYPSRESG